MTNTHFAVGQVLFREGDPADSVFRLLRGAVDIFRELDGEPILLGSVGAGQFIGEMGVVENRPRSATARAASQVEVEILTAAEFFDQIASSPPAARELIRRLSQRLREADDRIVNDERRSGRVHKSRKDAARGINTPIILRSVVTRSASKCENSPSARHYDQIRLSFRIAKTQTGQHHRAVAARY